MSERYEWYLGTPPACIRDPDDELWDAADDGNDERHWALVIGDPAATALVIYGDLADLRAAAAGIAAAVAALPRSDNIIDGDIIDSHIVPPTLALPSSET